jgi:hypothetical protein
MQHIININIKEKKMKNKIKIAALLTIFIGFAACDKNDGIDDWARIGQQVPHTYWELSSTVAKAGGDEVGFFGQYYTNGIAIENMSVWYNVIENLTQTAVCPLAPSINYSLSIDTSIEVREYQEIKQYVHNEDFWDKDLKAYTINSSFPVSNTLATSEWKQPADFDDDKFSQLFPTDFANNFKQGLYEKVSVDKNIPSYRAVLTATDACTVEDFNNCLDSVFNNNSQAWDKFIKEEKKSTLKGWYDAIPFKKLIYKSSESKYMITYLRSYTLDATFRVNDKQGNQGVSRNYTIEVN